MLELKEAKEKCFSLPHHEGGGIGRRIISKMFC